MKRFTLVQWDDHDDEQTQCVVYVLAPNGETQAHAEGDITKILSSARRTTAVITNILDALEGEAE